MAKILEPFYPKFNILTGQINFHWKASIFEACPNQIDCNTVNIELAAN